MTLEYKFEVDKENKVVRFGDKEFKELRLLSRMADVYSCFGQSRVYALNSPLHPSHVEAKAFTDKYGITPSNFRKVFNAKMFSLWVDPVAQYVNRFGYQIGGKVCPWKVRRIHKNLDKIQQAEKDGNEHLIPWIMHLDMCPKGLKEYFGKGLWKKISSQSMTRNKLLAERYNVKIKSKFTLESSITLPSFVLKADTGYISWDAIGAWAVVQSQLKGGDVKKRGSNTGIACVRLDDCCRDTQQMANSLGQPFSLKWNKEKMREKHDQYAEMINQRKYSPLPYEHLKNFHVPEIVHKGFKATLLYSPKLIHEEGHTMHHCVGMYADSVAKGGYLVYSVTKGGKRTSTIGFYKQKRAVLNTSGFVGGRDEWEIQQHYGHCNASVQDGNEILIAFELVKLLNRKD